MTTNQPDIARRTIFYSWRKREEEELKTVICRWTSSYWIKDWKGCRFEIMNVVLVDYRSSGWRRWSWRGWNIVMFREWWKNE